jgi:hypothetical protein
MTSIPQPDFSFDVGVELERLQGFNPIPIKGGSAMKHFRILRSYRAPPVFLINRPCRNQAKEWRRERWRDWQEANGRTSGWFGSNRELQFAYLHAAEVARRGGNYLLAKLHASCSREERRRSYINSLSPMALIEREAEDFHASPL